MPTPPILRCAALLSLTDLTEPTLPHSIILGLLCGNQYEGKFFTDLCNPLPQSIRSIIYIPFRPVRSLNRRSIPNLWLLFGDRAVSSYIPTAALLHALYCSSS